MTRFTTSLLLASALSFGLTSAQASDLSDEIVGYMDFATYESGIILPQQLSEDVFSSVTFVDTRDEEQFNQGTIPGAIHIEWREIPSRLDELPEDGMVVLFCNTGSLSAQATFAARVLGHENVLVLQSGRNGWLQDAAYKPE